jgi:hypothetical protein
VLGEPGASGRPRARPLDQSPAAWRFRIVWGFEYRIGTQIPTQCKIGGAAPRTTDRAGGTGTFTPSTPWPRRAANAGEDLDLPGATPRAQSGIGGDETRWRPRAPIDGGGALAGVGHRPLLRDGRGER